MGFLIDYIYFNKSVVDTMYAQISGWVPTHRTKKDDQVIEGGLGIPMTGIKAGGKKQWGFTEQSEITGEKKLGDILEYLNKNKLLSNNI